MTWHFSLDNREFSSGYATFEDCVKEAKNALSDAPHSNIVYIGQKELVSTRDVIPGFAIVENIIDAYNEDFEEPDTLHFMEKLEKLKDNSAMLTSFEQHIYNFLLKHQFVEDILQMVDVQPYDIRLDKFLSK